jgi:lipoate---protein ligase
MGWRVVGTEVGEPGALLEEGVRLLGGLGRDGTPTLRWYRGDRTAIILGRGQAAGLAAHSTGDVTVLSRYSGGGAVLMDPSLLSLDVLIPADSPLLQGDLAAVFVRCGTAWARALRDLGVPEVTVYEGAGTARRQGDARDRLLAAVCYATVGRGEVLTAGRKIVGLAQRRRREGALVQCGLLRRWRPGPLLEALGADPVDPEIEEAAIGLDEVFENSAKRAPTEDEVRAAVEACFEDLAEGSP